MQTEHWYTSTPLAELYHHVNNNETLKTHPAFRIWSGKQYQAHVVMDKAGFIHIYEAIDDLAKESLT